MNGIDAARGPDALLVLGAVLLAFLAAWRGCASGGAGEGPEPAGRGVGRRYDRYRGVPLPEGEIDHRVRVRRVGNSRS